MKKRKRYYKKYKFTYIMTTVFTLFFCTLFLRGYTPFERAGDNLFHVKVNGQEVGTLGDREEASELLIQARRKVASASDELMFMEAVLEVEGEEVLWGEVDDREQVLSNMEQALKGGIQESTHRSYTMKVNEYIVNLASIEEVNELLQAAVSKFDHEHKFQVNLVYDAGREFNVLTTRVEDASVADAGDGNDNRIAGIQYFFDGLGVVTDNGEEMDFEDYDLGISSMDFSEEVEIVESYLPLSQLTLLSEAIDQVTKEQEIPSIYEVVAGDTLSEIAIRVNIPMDDIVAMNDSLESINTTLQIGQKLVITVPEPELSVTRVETNYYEESYDAEVEYIYNDNWFTTTQVVHQAPSAGFRRVVAEVSYVNGKEVAREILKEEIVMEAVAKIVERGTKIPPTYIWPISGGRLSSGFGSRSRPTAGASSYHKGIDLATATGTAVKASCGGTVVKAGWASGYGYVVYINHEDGRQTRYGHLSRVLVKVGQKVEQGERIALSGNTGVSTGPHLHFEILINNSQVNPLNILPPR